jgi:hypothetical protein
MNTSKTKMNKHQNNFWRWLVGGLLLSGVVIALVVLGVGLAGWLAIPLFWVLIILFFWLVAGGGLLLHEVKQSSGALIKLAWLGLLGVWLVHSLGVLVPETGFDAVWYHLPVIARFLELGKIQYLPELYQSANPLLTDLLFLLGFQAGGELGAKLVAFGLGLCLLLVCCALARTFLESRWWLVWFLISVSLIQPVAWQSSSVYVDIGKAVWELGAVYFLFQWREKGWHWWLVLAGVMVGAALATKATTFALLPVFLVIILVLQPNSGWRSHLLSGVSFIVGVLVAAAPFYLYIWLAVGSPWQSLAIHFGKLEEIGGESSIMTYLVERAISLPLSWWYLTIQARDYVSVLLLIFLPLVVWQWPAIKRNINGTVLTSLTIFALAQWLIWWFTPPTSTRYAMAGFIVLLLLCFKAAEQLAAQSKNQHWQLALSAAVIIASVWHLLPRLVVAGRNARYLQQPDKAAYIRQFYDGNSDNHLKKWHQLP